MLRVSKRKNMAASKKQSKPSLTLSHPAHYFLSGYVNRYCLVREEDFTLCFFGLLNGKNELLEKWGFIFPASSLEALKDNLVSYSDQVGSPKSKVPKWTIPKEDADRIGNFPVVDFIHLCNWLDTHAEMCFWSYSQAKAADLARQPRGAEIQPWGTALIRCTFDLQRSFLEELYPE